MPDASTALPSYVIAAITPSPIADITAPLTEQFQPEDPILQELLPYLRDPSLPVPEELTDILSPFSLHDDLIYHGNLLYVPDIHGLKLDLCQQVHNVSTAGHLGQAKTHALLTKYYYFPGLRRFVNTYVLGCQTCQRNKTPRHKPYGPLQSLPIPTSPWRSITMDAIVKLPVSKGFDSIMVFVDRFTKQSHFVPFTENGFDSTHLATMFRMHIMRLHGIPTDIVSDRGSIFVSQFWRTFITGLGVKPNFSTAFHPQTDGQTERVNQVIEQYLRTYCDFDQANWVDLLDLAEFPLTP